MIDPIYKQQLRDQVEQMRELLTQIETNAYCMEILRENPGFEPAALFCGEEVSRLGIEVYHLAPDLCDTAARFTPIVEGVPYE